MLSSIADRLGRAVGGYLVSAGRLGSAVGNHTASVQYQHGCHTVHIKCTSMEPQKAKCL